MTQNTPENDQDYDHSEEEFEAQNFISGVAPSKTPGLERKLLPRTIAQYLGYVKTMRRKFLASSPEAHERDVLPVDLVDFLISRAPSLRPKTVINYRCGLLYWLGTLPETPDVHHARLVLQVGMPKTGYKGNKPKTTSTLYSSKSSRPRTFERRRFEKLTAELNRRMGPSPDQRKNRRPVELLFWLKAGLATGLRPIEWETARWRDRQQRQLLVKTAKRKSDINALPSLKDAPVKEYQERIVTVDEHDVIWVEQHMASVRRHLLSGEPFAHYYNNNRVYLWSVSRDLFGDKPPFTLYLMRGQFAANRKRRADPDEVAREMGCAPKVASTYYGKKRYAHSSSMPHTQDEQNRQALKEASSTQADRRFQFQRAEQADPSQGGV